MSNPSSPSPVFLTVEEVAGLLRVCRATVYTLIGQRADNGFPASKIGGTYRVRQSDLDAWLTGGQDRPDGVPTTD